MSETNSRDSVFSSRRKLQAQIRSQYSTSFRRGATRSRSTGTESLFFSDLSQTTCTHSHLKPEIIFQAPGGGGVGGSVKAQGVGAPFKTKTFLKSKTTGKL